MKKLLAIAALAAALSTTVPTQAMFSRMGKRIATTSALLGAGYTGYRIKKEIDLNKTRERSYNCDIDLARLTYEKLRSAQFYPWSTQFYKEELPRAFTYCQKNMSRDEMFDKNIDFANKSCVFWAHMGAGMKMNRFANAAKELRDHKYAYNNFNCNTDIAKLTKELFLSGSHDYMPHEAFEYCKKKMSPEEIYTRNITYAQKMKQSDSWWQGRQHQWEIAEILLEGEFNRFKAREQSTPKQEPKPDRVRELMPFWPA